MAITTPHSRLTLPYVIAALYWGSVQPKPHSLPHSLQFKRHYISQEWALTLAILRPWRFRLIAPAFRIHEDRPEFTGSNCRLAIETEGNPTLERIVNDHKTRRRWNHTSSDTAFQSALYRCLYAAPQTRSLDRCEKLHSQIINDLILLDAPSFRTAIDKPRNIWVTATSMIGIPAPQPGDRLDRIYAYLQAAQPLGRWHHVTEDIYVPVAPLAVTLRPRSAPSAHEYAAAIHRIATLRL